jgi:hypothetical protein
MESLQCLCIEVEFRTSTATSTIHGECTDLSEAVAYLRKRADEIETELRSEQSSTHPPSLSPVPSPLLVRTTYVTHVSQSQQA